MSSILEALEFQPIPEKTVPLEAILLVKALDEDGDVTWFSRYTDGITGMEALGLLTAELAVMKANVLSCRVDEDGDD